MGRNAQRRRAARAAQRHPVQSRPVLFYDVSCTRSGGDAQQSRRIDIRRHWSSCPRTRHRPRVHPGLWVPDTLHVATDLLIRLRRSTGMIHRWR